MTISLRHCVREAQHGNHEAVLFLLHEFEPLIRKYVKKYYMYYESLEEAISTADHAIVNCIFTFDLNKQDNPKDYKRECKIVCVNRYCMNLLYAPYWGKQR